MDNGSFVKKREECDCPKILIVDDNDFNIYTLQLILETSFNAASVKVRPFKVFYSWVGLQWGGCNRPDHEETIS